jgi:hypothetical protein
MKKSKLVMWMGIAIMAIALVIIIVPQFTNCTANGGMVTTAAGKQIPMKCYWTAHAEIAAGVPLLALGLLMALSRFKESIRNLSVLGIILGIITILLPVMIIGVCATPTMLCVTVMKPLMITCGAVAILASIVALIGSIRMKEEKA